MSKYWNDQGLYQLEYNELVSTLMESSGPSKTVGGEVIRAATKLYYDAYNNGFCNNTSGAMNYIKTYLLPHFRSRQRLILKDSIALVEPCTNCCGYGKLNTYVEMSLDSIIDYAVVFNRDNPEQANVKNLGDMYDLQDDDFEDDEEDFEDESDNDWEDEEE